ncbi:MAG: hypothetical protein AAGJ85_05655, partial [Pseudomonadota bacterium]
VKLKIALGSNTGQKMRLKGKGVNGKGHLIVELIVNLSPDEIEAGHQILAALPETVPNRGGKALRSDLIER